MNETKGTESLSKAVQKLLESDRSHELTHLLNELGLALSDGEITEARARLSEFRESYNALLGEVLEAARG